MRDKLTFDWQININTLILLGGIVSAFAVNQYRMARVEKEIAVVNERLIILSDQNNKAHEAIIEAAARVGTKLEEHVKYTVRP